MAVLTLSELNTIWANRTAVLGYTYVCEDGMLYKGQSDGTVFRVAGTNKDNWTAQKEINASTDESDRDYIDQQVTIINNTTNEITSSIAALDSFVIKDVSYTLLDTDVTVKAITEGTEISLSNAIGFMGKKKRIINASGGNITVKTILSQLIVQGDLESSTSFVLYKGEVLDVQSDNVNWNMI